MNRTQIVVLALVVVVSTGVIGGTVVLTLSGPIDLSTTIRATQSAVALRHNDARPSDSKGINYQASLGAVAEGPLPELSLPSSNGSIGETTGSRGALELLLQGEDESRILPVDEAFPFDYLRDRDQLILRWQTVEGHYLYRHRFAIHRASGEAISLQLPDGQLEKDPYFGDVYIFERPLEISVDLNRLMVNGEEDSHYRVTYQGCARMGYCYPPQHRLIEITRAGA